jgi:hypothetical protein
MRLSDMIHLVPGGVAGIGTSSGTSFGPFQLHVGGGLGDVFLKQTGFPLTNATIPQQIDFALDQAAKGGWGCGVGLLGILMLGLLFVTFAAVFSLFGFVAAFSNIAYAMAR